MYRQSPSRIHRSKGIKIKHVLQICLLLAVCFWLIYQVKHSHDKKKEFDESDSKTSLSRVSSNKISTLGRKDIRPRVEETVNNEKHDEAESEQESIEEVVEDDKHEELEQEIKKTEQREDEGMEGEDDEINAHKHEKSDAEIDREEEFIDEEKEGDEGGENITEEKDTEENNGEMEKEGSIEDNDHDGDEHSADEAREEHYKADDASSAVAHDNQIVNPENEKGSLENTKELPKTNILERENKENGEEINLGDKRTDLEVRDSDMAKSDDQSNVTINIEWKNKENGEEINYGDKRTNLAVKDGNMSKSDSQSNLITNEAEEKLKEKSENSSLSNTTLAEGSNDHIETSDNSLEVRMESRDPSLQNGTESKLVLNRGENGTTGGRTSGEANNSTSDMGSSHVDSNSTIPPKNKDLDSSSWELSDLSKDSESSVAENIRSELSVEVGNNTESLTVKNDATEAEKSVNDGGTDDFSDKTSEEVQHDPIDLSDSSNSLDQKDVLTNHETLPEIQSAGTSREDAAAE